jgi:hypothetical protein
MTVKDEEVPNRVICHFQRRFFSTAFHFSEKDTIDLWVVSVNKSTKSMEMKTKHERNLLESCCSMYGFGRTVLARPSKTSSGT